ncbi:hypothetical protein Poly30_05670 [Planctomycetes bacterium Poly30]|uniref:Uncharacterized protein n=1 Tax=Saltatorellus ferox TaxID=2528018 RepID=A0A518ELW2_9BACT|nr:hypothetical protein Poly30_05670 [Planctomycetes bacterium Poly30]
MLVSLCLLASAPLQQSIQAVATYTATEIDSASAVSGVDSTFALASAVVDARLNFAIPTGDGVRTREVFAEGVVVGSFELDATALSSAGTEIYGIRYDGRAACGGLCTWGPSDYNSTGGSVGSGSLLGPGESVSYVQGPFTCDTFTCIMDTTITDSSPDWSTVVNGASFSTSLSLGDVSLTGRDGSGNLVPFQLDLMSSSASASTTVIVTYELDAALLTEYCTSPAGSTGTAATLAAFGSQQEGTEYLTIRAENLQASSFAILFVATAPANVPMGSYNLCVGGSVTRQGGVQPTGTGSADFDLQLTNQSQGDTVYLQTIYRDSLLGVGATNAASFVVQPR